MGRSTEPVQPELKHGVSRVTSEPLGRYVRGGAAKSSAKTKHTTPTINRNSTLGYI